MSNSNEIPRVFDHVLSRRPVADLKPYARNARTHKTLLSGRSRCYYRMVQRQHATCPLDCFLTFTCDSALAAVGCLRDWCRAVTFA